MLADSSAITGNCIAGTGLTELDVDNRVTSVTSYTASQQVDLLNGFSSNYGDNYEAYIDSTITPCVQPDTLAAGNYYKADVITAGDYYPFGMKMPGREYKNPFASDTCYRYGFNGKRKDDAINGDGYDYGDRMYDARIGRWLSIDPLQNKYPSLSPYNFCANDPVLFVDYGGKNFGIKIDHTKKTILIIANIYATSKTTYQQAMAAAKKWNAKTSQINGYTVSFQINIIQTSSSVFSDKELKDNPRNRDNSANSQAEEDNIGNEYTGTDSYLSQEVTGQDVVGGATAGGEYVFMNTDDEVELGDMGNYPDLVAHEFGHLLGLRDKGADNYYPGDDGIMHYQPRGTSLSPISDNDVKTIIKYAKDKLESKVNDPNTSRVTLLEETGHSSGNNPLSPTGGDLLPTQTPSSSHASSTTHDEDNSPYSGGGNEEQPIDSNNS